MIHSFIYKIYWYFLECIWVWIRATRYHQMQWHKHQEHSTKSNEVGFHRYRQIKEGDRANTKKIHYSVHNK